MALSPAEVSACLVTRGDQDLTPILDSLAGFDEVLIWNNTERENRRTAGRHYMALEARNSVCYFQDDDFLVHDPAAVVAAYTPGYLTSNMTPAWRTANDCEDLALVGMGAVVERRLPWLAIEHYLREYPQDEFFYYWIDFAVGVLTPHRIITVPVEVMPWGYGPSRMNGMPTFHKDKAEMTRRARYLRETAAVA